MSRVSAPENVRLRDASLDVYVADIRNMCEDKNHVQGFFLLLNTMWYVFTSAGDVRSKPR